MQFGTCRIAGSGIRIIRHDIQRKARMVFRRNPPQSIKGKTPDILNPCF